MYVLLTYNYYYSCAHRFCQCLIQHFFVRFFISFNKNWLFGFVNNPIMRTVSSKVCVPTRINQFCTRTEFT